MCLHKQSKQEFYTAYCVCIVLSAHLIKNSEVEKTKNYELMRMSNGYGDMGLILSACKSKTNYSRTQPESECRPRTDACPRR